MTRAAVLRPKQPALAIATGVLCTLAILVHFVLAVGGTWRPGRLGGLVAGSLAAALYLVAACYPARRRLRAWPLSSAQRWLQLHIYGSVLAVVLVLIHIGFEWPAGAFGWTLFGLTVWTSLSGLAGVYLQKALPLILARDLRVEAIAERVPAIVQQLAVEADAVMSRASAVAVGAYRSEVRPLLECARPRWSYLLDVRGGGSPELERLRRVTQYLEPADRDRVAELETIARDKLDLDVHLSLQRALRLWLVTHVPPAIVLMGLLVVHLFAVLYF
jgi:hypothetical protein